MLFRSLLRYASSVQATAARRRARKRPVQQRTRTRLSVEALEDRNLPSTYTVDHLADDLGGSGLNGSLRYCITRAADGDSIQFGVTGTINLTGALPSLNHNINIEGPGADQLTVRRDTGGNYRIFTVASGATVVLSGLTIANGLIALQTYDTFSGGGIYNSGMLTLNNATVSGNAVGGLGFGGYEDGSGGGIWNTGTVTLNNATVSGNSASSELVGNGGGIGNYTGTVVLNNSTVSANGAGAGGGVSNYLGTVTLNNATVSANGAEEGGGILGLDGTVTLNNATVSGNFGGGIWNSGTVTLNNSTVSSNGHGSGITNEYTGTVTVNNSTVSGNNSFGGYHDAGGGINNYSGTLTVNNSTVSGNTSGAGGGIYNGGTLNARNTIIAGNTASYRGPDLYGSVTSSGYNLIGNSTGGSGYADTDLLDVDANLGPLQNNGGPTNTMPLLAGSPALNAGNPAQLGVADQRGVVRAGGVNIGAYQASASAFVVTVPATVASGTSFDVTVQAVDAFGQVAFGYRGTVTFSVTDPDPAVLLPADYAFTADDPGTHTFTGGFTLITPGPWTLTVADLANGLSIDVPLTVNS
jgi:hypothetical protein